MSFFHKHSGNLNEAGNFTETLSSNCRLLSCVMLIFVHPTDRKLITSIEYQGMKQFTLVAQSHLPVSVLTQNDLFHLVWKNSFSKKQAYESPNIMEFSLNSC